MAPPAPPDPVLAALARIEAARANPDGLSPRGPLAAWPRALAGMVWSAPDDRAAALDELLAMRRTGVRVVRTGLIADTLVLRAGDLLGLSFYQDLPIANLPAPALLDTLAYAERLLGESLARAQGYQSARHYGLTLYSDTSDPRARPYFERLASLAQTQGPDGVQVYYLSRFPASDRCAALVDLVLLDARDGNPAAVLAQWRERQETPAGIGSFGAPVRPGRDGGWRLPGTQASQARILESGLGGLLEGPPPAVFFVHRWRDGRADAALDQRAEVQGVGYGMLDEDGRSRLALDVVAGFYTGTQRVFAFDAGTTAPEARTAAPLVLMGWLIIIGLGLLYGFAPRFGTLASRYFGRHDLYRESIQRGYDLNAGLNVALGLGLVIAAGIVGAASLRGLGRTDALATAISGWAAENQARLTDLLGIPFALVGVIALLYVLWLLFNMIWLLILAGRRYRIRPPQALTLVIWSRWSVFALMVGAMLLATMPPRTATAFVPVLLFSALIAEVVATGRMLVDFGNVARVPMQRAVLVGYWAPLGAIATVLLVGFLFGRAELGFLWHLATRS